MAKLPIYGEMMMPEEKLRYAVYKVESGRQYGLLIRKRTAATIEYAYFYFDRSEGLAPTEEILRICGKRHEMLIYDHAPQRKIVKLLKGYAEAASRHGGRPGPQSITNLCDEEMDYTIDLSHFFRDLRPKISYLRDFLGTRENFDADILVKDRGANIVTGRAEEFGVITPNRLVARSNFRYLQPIKHILRMGEKVKPKWFRKTGPVAADFEAGVVFPRQELLKTLISLVQQNNICLLTGIAATGKSVLVKHLAYDLFLQDQMPVFYFGCDEDREFHWVHLLDEIQNTQGLVVIDDIHLAAEKIQSICTRLQGRNATRLLLTARSSLCYGQRDKYKDLTTLPSYELSPFQDVTSIMDHFLRHNSLARIRRRIRYAIKRASHESFWLLAYALEGYAKSKGGGNARQWLADGIQTELRELEKLKEPYASQYPEILVALSPLYKNEVLTEQSYLLQKLGFEKEALSSLVRRGEITWHGNEDGQVSYGLPHSALADAYWRHGTEYRKAKGFAGIAGFVYDYAISNTSNGLSALAHMASHIRRRLLVRLYESGHGNAVIERERSLKAIQSWLDTLYGAMRERPRGTLLALLARKLNKATNLTDIAGFLSHVYSVDTWDTVSRSKLWSLINQQLLAKRLSQCTSIEDLEFFAIAMDAWKHQGRTFWPKLDFNSLGTTLSMHADKESVCRCVFHFFQLDAKAGTALWEASDCARIISDLEGRGLEQLFQGLFWLVLAESDIAEESWNHVNREKLKATFENMSGKDVLRTARYIIAGNPIIGNEIWGWLYLRDIALDIEAAVDDDWVFGDIAEFYADDEKKGEELLEKMRDETVVERIRFEAKGRCEARKAFSDNENGGIPF